MKVGLVGNQNSGKTTLFNCLTGMNAKIGNWPGVTIEKKVGTIKGTSYEITDLPGIYSLSPYSVEEEVSRNFVFNENADVIINIVDATCLERSLFLTTQLLESNCKIIVALNMADKLEEKGLTIDEKRLEEILGTRVIKISALKETGIDEIIKELNKPVEKKEKKKIPEYLDKNYDINKYEEVVTNKYAFIENMVKECVKKKIHRESLTDKLDKVFLNKILAFPIFIVIMFLVYYLSVGIVGSFTVDWVGEVVGEFGEWVGGIMGNAGTSEWINSLVVDGIIAGVGAVLGFVPQLIILFLCIALLETTGYMSRIALLLDKIFRKIGLSGKSLIPFIVGSGCSVPGIMGSRIIENEDERTMTTILTPFIPCSAKLPIIALFAGYFFPESSGIASASLYFFAIAVIILSALIMKKFVFKHTSSTYISELPEYRLPSAKYIAKEVTDKVLAFIKRAGTIILLCSVIIWFLLSFSFNLKYGVDIEDSILATIGNKISWIFYPMLGAKSWGATVSAIQGLVAKEQVVSSMAVINGLSADVEEGAEIFAQGGTFGFFTAASAYAFMVFNLFSAPCFGAIGAMRRELGSSKQLLKAIAFQTGLAWILATIVYQVGSRINNINIADLLVGLAIVMIIILIIRGMNQKRKDKCTGCPYCKSCEK